MSDTVLTTVGDDGVAAVTLCRPHVGNALNLDMSHDLCAAFDSLNGDESVRVILLRAEGDNFCVGGDVGEMSAAGDRGAFLSELAGRAHDALLTLRELPVPVVTAVRGAAAGAGLGLVLASDIVVADPTAKFLTAYAGVGLSPDCGVSALLSAVVGVRRAALLALTGKVLDGVEALDWGLITEVCSSDQAEARATELCAAIASGPAAAIGEAARLLRVGVTPHYREHLAQEASSISRLATTADAGARIDAFVHRQGRKDRSA